MILDDGGDATLLLYLGAQAEKDPSVLDNPDSEEQVALFNSIQKASGYPSWLVYKGIVKDPGCHGRNHHRRENVCMKWPRRARCLSRPST